jgi:hypothetical protein
LTVPLYPECSARLFPPPAVTWHRRIKMHLLWHLRDTFARQRTLRWASTSSGEAFNIFAVRAADKRSNKHNLLDAVARHAETMDALDVAEAAWAAVDGMPNTLVSLTVHRGLNPPPDSVDAMQAAYPRDQVDQVMAGLSNHITETAGVDPGAVGFRRTLGMMRGGQTVSLYAAGRGSADGGVDDYHRLSVIKLLSEVDAETRLVRRMRVAVVLAICNIEVPADHAPPAANPVQQSGWYVAVLEYCVEYNTLSLDHVYSSRGLSDWTLDQVALHALDGVAGDVRPLPVWTHAESLEAVASEYLDALGAAESEVTRNTATRYSCVTFIREVTEGL